MKRFFNFSSLIFNFYKAYQSLRDLFDPAMEGGPYGGESEEINSLEVKKAFSFKKKFSWR